MELPELILFVSKWSHSSVENFCRGARKVAAEDLSFISSTITKELPNIKLTKHQPSESPGPAEPPG